MPRRTRLALVPIALALALAAALAPAGPARAAEAGKSLTANPQTQLPGDPHPDLPDPQFTFHTFLVTWGNTASPQFLDYLKEARPEVVQANFYGPMFHGYADNAGGTGYPMQLPVRGQREALASQKQTIDEAHALGLKVVSHFQMVNVIHDLEKPLEAFVGFYNDRWPEDLLGPRPVADYRELLQRKGDGEPMVQEHYVNYFGLCLNSPPTRQMLKAMLKLAIDQGVDGVVANYNYYWGCACPHCQASFQQYLRAHYTPEQLRDQCGIADLDQHHFATIPARIPGYPDVKAASELDWAAHRWAAINFKQNFDEVLIEYGRSLKPDLIVATWNHIGDVGISEERAFTPIELWGKGENYFWYSGGHWPTDFSKRYAADSWLTCAYIRELSGGKPFMMGKYDGSRPRMNIAEGVATGGGGMGLQLAFMDPIGAEAGARYTKFVHQHAALWRHARPRSDVALILPRQSSLAGHPDSHEAFRIAGTDLVRQQVLFDVVADQKLTAERLAGYAAVVLPQATCLSATQADMLETYLRDGGQVLAIGPIGTLDEDGRALATPRSFAGLKPPATQTDQPPTAQSVGKGRVVWVSEAEEDQVAPALFALAADRITRIDGHWTLRAAAVRQPGMAILHLVNFNRDEEAAKALSGPAAEMPIPAHDVKVSLALRPGERVESVTLLSPDEQEERTLEVKQSANRVEFIVPRILVYAVVRMGMAKAPAGD